MSLSIHCFVILVAATYFEPSSARRDFSILFDTCEVRETSKYCDMNCTVSKSHKLTTYLNVLEKASYFGASIQLFAKSLRANEFMKVFDHSFNNICTFMSNSQLGNMFLIILDEVKEFGKVPTCPAEKDIFYLKDYSFSVNKLPLYVPEGQFWVSLAWDGHSMNGTYSKCANISIKGHIQSKFNLFWNSRRDRNRKTNN